ncbi:MAG: phosphoribosylformylglycinamidine cyclo-ligase [Candidatus Omnitrophica bacterium]|nr:phosphoribosylformylglycinamidine cyclo-ligase [Candidatus Omnitrophota bacterium]
MMEAPLTYKDAGVDIEAGEEATRRLKAWVSKTRTPQVLSEVGGFGGLFHLAGCPEADPVLVSSIDGVGTKMKVAAALGRYGSVGHDIVNHCANDILVQGARPLFFLDYIGANKVIPEQVAEVVRGVSEACVEHGCALIGGETAEMPDVYGPGDIDLVGTIIGVVDRNKILNGSRVVEGDALIGLASNGLHTNGYTLARKALYGDRPELLRESPPTLGESLGAALLAPHRSYFKMLWPLLEQGKIHALAHITGGGIPGNLSRVIPARLSARVETRSWNVPPLFELIGEKSRAPRAELYRALNMGVGMIAVVSFDQAEEVRRAVADSGVEAWVIGEVRARGEGSEAVVTV